MREIIDTFDKKLISIIMYLPASWHGFFLIITSLGDPIVTVGIGIAIAFFGFIQQNMRLALSGSMVWVALIAGSGLKLLFERQRPLTEYAANLQIHTYSFPSGHSSGSVVAYGLVAYICWHILPQPWGWIIAILAMILIVSIGMSRIYLGAHFPSDVLAGWILGCIALSIIIFIVRPLE
jgi:undecaprenyl-diphosphatase